MGWGVLLRDVPRQERGHIDSEGNLLKLVNAWRAVVFRVTPQRPVVAAILWLKAGLEINFRDVERDHNWLRAKMDEHLG